MKSVLIAEKGEQAEKYAKALNLKKENSLSKNSATWIGKMPNSNDDLVIVPLQGHVLRMFLPNEYDEKYSKFNLDNLPFFPTDYKKKVENKYIYNNAKKYLDKADEIIIGTDIDPEGELIAYETIQFSGNGNKPIKRLWLSDTTKKNIIKGINNLKDKDFSFKFYKQSATRQISDYLIGMNLTPNFTVKYSNATHNKELFSIGRVQVPTVWLIKNREDKIKNWTYKKYRKLEIVVEKNGKSVIFNNNHKYYDDEEFSKAINDNNLKNIDSILIDEVEKNQKATPSPKLFSMASLRGLAGKKYGYEPEETDKLLQETHMGDNLTYPRTEIDVIPSERYDMLKDNFDSLANLINYRGELIEPVKKDRYVNDKKAREHVAIVPTHKIPNLSEMDSNVKNIYLLAVYRTMMMFAGEYKYNQTVNTINIGNLTFKNTQNITTDYGWKKLKLDNQNEDEEPLPFEKGEQLSNYKIRVVNGTDQPPKHITKNSLTDDKGEMAKNNLGKPSTQTNIVETILKRGYVQEIKEKGKKKHLELTTKGELLCKLTKNSVLSSPEMTKQWEDVFTKIVEGSYPPYKFINTIKKFINKTLEEPLPIKDEELIQISNKIADSHKIADCPICNDGIMVDKNKLIVCNKCDFKIWKNFIGKKLTKTQIEQLCTNGKTNSKLKFKSKNGKEFTNYIVLNKADKRLELAKFDNK